MVTIRTVHFHRFDGLEPSVALDTALMDHNPRKVSVDHLKANRKYKIQRQPNYVQWDVCFRYLRLSHAQLENEKCPMRPSTSLSMDVLSCRQAAGGFYRGEITNCRLFQDPSNSVNLCPNRGGAEVDM